MKTIPLHSPSLLHTAVKISAGFAELGGELELPPYAPGVVLFAHGGGSSRHDPRERYAASIVREAGFGTLQFDLLTHREQQQDDSTSALRLDIDLLAQRLIGVTCWLEKQTTTRGLKVGLFGFSTCGTAALMAAAKLGDRISAVVSCGGRPDLAGHVLHQVRSPTLRKSTWAPRLAPRR